MGRSLVEIIRSIGEGMSQVMVISPDREFIRPKRSGFMVDSMTLSNDARQIGNDLRKQIKYSNGEPTYQR